MPKRRPTSVHRATRSSRRPQRADEPAPVTPPNPMLLVAGLMAAASRAGCARGRNPMAAMKSARSAATKPTSTSGGPSSPSRVAVVEGHNEVVLGGRVSGEPTTRVLPSGDELVSWRLVVGRDKRGVSPAGRQLPTVDTIDCVAFKSAVRRTAARWAGGELIEVRGELRRRFWRGAQGAASRCEVEVLEIKRISAAS